MRAALIPPVLVVSLLAAACGDSVPAAPMSPTAPPSDAIVINILGNRGAQSFSPNPESAMNGQTVIWHNTDTIAHRVVLDDGELDSGVIAPGASSAPMVLVEPSSYHCSIHPSMVGRIDPH